MTDEEIINTATANAHATSAVAILLRHVVHVLSHQPQIDKVLLKNQIVNLPVPTGDDAFLTIYSALKAGIVEDLSE